jgi:hypothetical protein
MLSVVAWLMLAFGVGDPDHLAARGIESLKYFTVLSNLLMGLASAITAVFYIMASGLPAWVIILKLTATASVMLTFTTVVALLGPTLGWKGMYTGGNLYMHLVLPLLAIMDLVLFIPVGRLPLWATLLSMVPCALYGLWYMRTVYVHGVKENGKVYDFYGFLRWGWGKVPFLFMGMLAFVQVVALALWFCGRV